MSELSKQELEALIRPHLGKDLVVESFTSKHLTEPGENYGSIVLAIEVSVHHEGDKLSSHNLSLVAKLPPTTEMQWKIFYPPTTFCKEIDCYLCVKKEHREIQIEKNVPKDKFCDVFPECYGARTLLSGEITDKASKDAALLLENLKTQNYRLGDRTVGLDLKHVQLAVSQLARFHALSTAIKMLKPNIFKTEILKACKPHFFGFSKKEVENNINSLMNNVKIIPECEPYINRIKKASEEDTQLHLNKCFPKPKEPYATLSHMDFWVNNMMFGYDSNDNDIPIDIKFVDFQIVLYTSPVKDLIFFLYTSLADGVRAKYYDDLIHLYHEHFTDCLESVGCDTSPFSFQSLLDEIEEFAPTEMHHILFMLTAICIDKEDVPDMENLEESKIYSKINKLYLKRVKDFILDFVQRGWL